jgi:glycosyltransferase involved in cell wall biosynthesis
MRVFGQGTTLVADAELAAARDLRVVVTHDFMETYGGAERVTEEMARAFPEAPVVAVLGRPDVAARMGVADRFRSVLPPRRALLENYRYLAPVLPSVVDRMRLPDADVVLSSSYGFAHRFRHSAPAHLCYCHSPLRFAWSMRGDYRSRWASGGASRLAFDALAAGLRRSDRRSASRPNAFVTQSHYVADQIRRFYGRKAAIVGAPVDCDTFVAGGEPGDYYLVCARLIEPYKRTSIVLDAFRQLPGRLVVAGDGPAMGELRRMAPPNVEFTGHLEDDALVPLMQRCRALVFPSCDDFGLAPLEVMACGRPVLAYRGGGALSTVLPGVTGEFFDEQTPDAVRRAVGSFDPSAYAGAEIRRHAEHWDRRAFRRRIVACVLAAAGGHVVDESVLPAPIPAHESGAVALAA